MRIFLSGFMGAGKSHTGRQIARHRGVPFLDLDEWIEQEEGKSIPQIFMEQGEDYFRELEANFLRKTSRFDPLIIATGGGTPCFHNNMEWMNKNGVTIYLKATPELLARRLERDTVHRPLLENKSGQDLVCLIKDLLEKRSAFYESAHIVCDIDAPSINIADELVKHLGRYLKL